MSTNEYPQLLEIEVGDDVHDVTFTANGEHLISGSDSGVQVWRIEDGQRVATLQVQSGVYCVAASQDGKYIAAGSWNNKILVWDTVIPELVFSDKIESSICDVDFSFDSTHLVSAYFELNTATILDIAARKHVQTLDHRAVHAAKYSPQGDRIATAAGESVRVWDCDGRLLVVVEVGVEARRGLLWRSDHLFIIAQDGKIKQIDPFTGFTVFELPVPYTNPDFSCISLPRNGKFIACSAEKIITFSDTSANTQFRHIQYTEDIRSMSYSFNGMLLAIATGQKIFVNDSSSVVFRAVSEPEFGIDAWSHGQLPDSSVLSPAIPTSQNSAHHVLLASRALVRAHSGLCDAALVDAKRSIKIQRSLLGYVAKSVALINKGEKDEGIRVCDIAFQHFHSKHASLLLLIKAVILFMAGDRVDAISRMDDLITDNIHALVDPALYVVQAYMHLLLGNKHMENKDNERAIRSFGDARIKLGNCTRQPPPIISLIAGWCFDALGTTIKKRLCEALLGVAHAIEATECVGCMLHEDINMTEPIETWISDFKYRYRSKLEDLGDGSMKANQYDGAVSQYSAALSLNLGTPQTLLMKRSNACVGMGARDRALNDAKEWARLMITSSSWEDALAVAVGFALERFTIRQVICEHLEMTGRVADTVACFYQTVSSEPADEEQVNWARDFKSRCRGKLGDLGDNAANAKQYNEAVLQYTAALSLDSVGRQDLLMKRSNAWVGKGEIVDALNDVKEWAGLMLMSGSWEDALVAAVGFTLQRFRIYRVVCEHLETTNLLTDAVACFHQMSSELAQEVNEEQATWTHDFKSRCRSKIEHLGDSALNAKQYEEAVSQYTTALSLDPTAPKDLLVKRSEANAEDKKWEDALNDANKAIKLDPFSPWGYERKHAALLGLSHYDDAIDAFQTMLSKISESPDPTIRERSGHYVRPEQTKEAIRISVQMAIRDSPLVLINASSGRLCNKSEQAAAFDSTPDFTKLVASTTTYINHTLINRVVGEFYRYATFSHTWEGNEPLYETIIKTVVYDLEAFPTHSKLQMFCQIVRNEGFNWAWSDTCCINKGDQFILQEALVSMFKWYEGSAITIIFLCDVDQLAEIGALMMSLWNSRGWTLQEYHASKVVRIYTKNWTPYLGLTIYNHKESSEIVSEMEKATGISAESLKALRPGLNDIREKLRLASKRQTTRVEDTAYSLLGIFSMTLPVTYGEGDKALGRLLSQLLTSSGDTSILAWVGKPGSFNSCLPAKMIVFSQPLTLHIPPPIPDAEMEVITAALRASSLDLYLVASLYHQLNALPLPFFVVQRMKLPCLAFRIRIINPVRNGVFRAQASALGSVEIKTRQNIAQVDSLYLVHPWVDFLLDRHATGNIIDIPHHEDDSFDFPESFDIPDISNTLDEDPLDSDDESPPSPVPVMDTQIEFLARLRQPFGALLLAPTRRNVPEYRRIATESVITAQVKEITSGMLKKLVECVRVLDVL